jgi:hypothetical protein
MRQWLGCCCHHCHRGISSLLMQSQAESHHWCMIHHLSQHVVQIEALMTLSSLHTRAFFNPSIPLAQKLSLSSSISIHLSTSLSWPSHPSESLIQGNSKLPMWQRHSLCSFHVVHRDIPGHFTVFFQRAWCVYYAIGLSNFAGNQSVSSFSIFL